MHRPCFENPTTTAASDLSLSNGPKSPTPDRLESHTKTAASDLRLANRLKVEKEKTYKNESTDVVEVTMLHLLHLAKHITLNLTSQFLHIVASPVIFFSLALHTLSSPPACYSVSALYLLRSCLLNQKQPIMIQI